MEYSRKIKNFSEIENKKGEAVVSLKEGEFVDCFKKVAGPAILAGLTDILIRIDLSTSSRPFILALSWSIRFILLFYISYQAVFNYKKDIRQAAILGILAGGIVGLFSAGYNLFLIKKLWAGFNLVVEPIWMGLLAGLVVMALSWLLKKFKK